MSSRSCGKQRSPNVVVALEDHVHGVQKIPPAKTEVRQGSSWSNCPN